MNKVLIQTADANLGNNGIFTPDINNVSQYWREFKRQLHELNYELTTADSNTLEDCRAILFMESTSVERVKNKARDIRSLIKKLFRMNPPRNWPTRPLHTEAIEKNMYDKMGLMLWEGMVINPDNYNEELWNKFKYILTWNDDLVDNKKFFKYVIPATIVPEIQTKLSFNQKKLLVTIAHNRYSNNPNELYSARRRSIIYFTAHHPNDFDLYGARWGNPITRLQQYFPGLIYHFSSYRGIAQNKWETLSHYKFNICYENMANAAGYITDKIFDSLNVGTVPIYWGARNIDQYIDSDAFIDRRKFKDDAELAKYLFSITKEEHNKMVQAGQRYLKSEKFKQFSQENFGKNIIKVLRLEHTD